MVSQPYNNVYMHTCNCFSSVSIVSSESIVSIEREGSRWKWKQVIRRHDLNLIFLAPSDNKKQKNNLEQKSDAWKGVLGKAPTTHLFPVEPLEGWQNLLAKFQSIAPPAVWKILIKKTCTVKKWTTLEIFYCRWMGVWRLKSRSQNLTNRYNRQGKWKIKHHCHCHAPESVLKVSSPLFLKSLRKEEVPHLVIKMWNQWSWWRSERGFRTIDRQPGPGRCPTGSQSS